MIATVITAMLVFARVGGLIMALPGLSTQSVPAMARLAAALPLTLVLFPAAAAARVPDTVSTLVAAVLAEAVLGLAMGFAASLAFGALTAGADMIGAQSGLQIATLLDPLTMSNTSAVAVLATWLGTAVFFGTDLHLVCIGLLGASLREAPPGALADVTSAGALLVPLAGSALYTGVQLAGPLTIFVFLVNVGLSLLGRMAPNMHLFFAVGPTITVVAALALLAAAMPSLLGAWMAFMPEGLSVLRALPTFGG